MSKILLRACAACLIVVLTGLLLAACGAEKEETAAQGSLSENDAKPGTVMGNTLQRISDKIPKVGEVLSLPTATPRHGEPTATRIVVVNLLPTTTPTPVRLAGGYLGVITTNQLNVRSEPTLQSDIIAAISRQDCVTLLENKDGWYRIDMPAAESGWVSSELIQVVAQCPIPGAPNPIAIISDDQAAYTEISAVASDIVEVAAVVESVAPAPAPMVPNAALVSSGNIHECFGTGDDEIRPVRANTPVEVLGTGSFWPPDGQQDRLGPGPFLKIRLWDGQYAWIGAEHVGYDIAQAPEISGQCEDSDRLDWSTVYRPTPPPTPRPVPTARPVSQPAYRPPIRSASRSMPTPRPVSGASQYDPTPTVTPTPTADEDHRWFDE